MTREELQTQVTAKFPSLQLLAPAVKNYLTLRSGPADILAVVAWLKEEMGFRYLDMITAVDLLGPVDARGFIADPNPNVFLPEGATPQIEAPAKSTGFQYRDSFELVYLLSNLEDKLKVALKVEITRSDTHAPSLTPLFKAADWQEREVYDLFGIRFDGHPNLAKILTPDFMQGHPLRKDYVHVKDRFD